MRSIITIHDLQLKSYYISKARPNSGKFNIRFQGPKIWNSTDKIKAVSLPQFKSKIKQHYLSLYIGNYLVPRNFHATFRSFWNNTCQCISVFECVQCDMPPYID